MILVLLGGGILFISWFSALSSIRIESVNVDLTERMIHFCCNVINPASGCGRNWRNQGTFLRTKMSFHGKKNKENQSKVKNVHDQM